MVWYVKTDGSFRRARRWIALAIALLASSLVVLLVVGRAPHREIYKVGNSRPAMVSAHPPDRAESHVHSDAQRIPAPTPGLIVIDQLCGAKGTDLKRAGNETFVQHLMRVTQAVISEWENSLAASEDPRHQAMGLALENMLHPEAPVNEPKDTPVNNRLVLLAIDANDPAVYALALGQCVNGRFDMAAGPCQGLSWEHWANIDPDNAVPWLRIAAKAARSGDQQTVEEALAKASMASHFDGYSSTFSTLALSALPPDIGPLDKAVAGADVMSSLPLGIPPDIAVTLCSDIAVQQPTRRQQCKSIANALADSGTTEIEVAVARGLAMRLGFSADQQAKLRLEQANAGYALRAHNPWSYTSEGSGLTLQSNFSCDMVLGYDDLIDAIQAAGGNERAALAAVARTLPPRVYRDFSSGGGHSSDLVLGGSH